MSNKTKTYNVNFPVYKQGDDFSCELEANGGDARAALKSLAKRYMHAANVAECLLEKYQDEWVIDGDCHYVSLQAEPGHAVDQLIALDVIDLWPDEDDSDN